MPFSLVLFTGIAVILALSAVVQPKTLFAFPVISSLLLLAYIIPQCWFIAQNRLLDDFEPTLTWTYMLTCMVMTVLGFRLGSVFRRGKTTRTLADFNTKRLLIGALVSSAVGMVGYVLMISKALTEEQSSQWTGVITFYALLATLTLFGTTLSWLLYLRLGNKIALANALFGFSVSTLTILIAARREVAFVVFASGLLAIMFTRNYRPPRTLIVLAVLCGSVFINEAGPIRNYMATNKATMATAITNIDLLNLENYQATEVSSAVTDIAIAQWNNQYLLFDSYYNMLTHLYFPAFIFGREAKDAASIEYDIDDSIVGSRYNMAGSTRTGFSSSFLSFHFMGSLVFFIIAFFMGNFWRRANAGEIDAQFYYIALLPDGIKIFTESTERFVGFLPFIFGWMMIIFALSRVRTSAPAARGSALLRPGAAS